MLEARGPRANAAERIRCLVAREDDTLDIDQEERDFLRLFDGVLHGDATAVLDFPQLLAAIYEKGCLIDMDYVTNEKFAFADALLSFMDSDNPAVLDAALSVLATLVSQDSAEFIVQIAYQVRFTYHGSTITFMELLPQLAAVEAFEDTSLHRKVSLCTLIAQLHSFCQPEMAKYLPFFHKCLYSNCPELFNAAGKSARFIIISDPRAKSSSELFYELPFDADNIEISTWFFRVVIDRIRQGILDFDLSTLLDKLGSPITTQILQVLIDSICYFPDVSRLVATQAEKLGVLVTSAELCRQVLTLITKCIDTVRDTVSSFASLLPVLLSIPSDQLDFETRVQQTRAITSIIHYTTPTPLPNLDAALEWLSEALVIDIPDLRRTILTIFLSLRYTSPALQSHLLTITDDPEIGPLAEAILAL